MSSTDSIAAISAVNLARCLRWHPTGPWAVALSDWAVALAGEAGELCNVVKKLNRERDGLVGNNMSLEQLKVEFRKEIADVYLYLDLIAQREGINLAEAVAEKFNEVSIKNGFPERL